MGLDKIRNWSRIALLNFILAALAGLVMRYAFFGNVFWFEFKNLLQAHSHMAMLGWVFLALVILISYSFELPNKKWKAILVMTQLAVIGMFISLLLIGYKSVSIIFLVLHMVFAAVIVWIIIKGLTAKKRNDLFSNTWLKTSLFFLILSFLGPLLLGPITMMGLRGSAWYYAAIQFFLHFQFNGWMIFAIMALFFKFIESNDIPYQRQLAKKFYVLLVISCFLTFALAIAWSNPYLSVFLVNSIGVIVQLAAIVLFWKLVVQILPKAKEKISKPILWLFGLSFLMLSMKIGIQSLIVFPFVAKIAYTIRFFVIGFIHLILLGVVSFSVFAFLYQSKALSYKNPVNKLGIRVFTIGFVLTEGWMFFQGMLLWARKGFIPYYHEFLFVFTCFLIIGILCIWIGSIKTTQSQVLNQPRESLQYRNEKLINKIS